MKLKKTTSIFLIILFGMQIVTKASVAQAAYQVQNQIIYQTSPGKILLKLADPVWDWETVKNGVRLYSASSFPIDIHGLPSIPVFSTLVAIPPTGDFEVTTVFSDQQIINPPGEMILIESRNAIAFESEIGEQIAQEFTCEQVYPETPLVVDSPVWIRDQRVVRVQFHPFQWDCLKQVWYYTPQMQVELIWETHDSLSNTANQNSIFEDVLKENLINYQDGRNWRGFPFAVNQENPTLPKDVSDGKFVNQHLKISVLENGIYQIRFEDLISLAPDLSQSDPHHFFLENQGRPVSFRLSADEDAIFEAGESLLFYGQKLDGEYLASLYPHQDDFWISFANGWTPQFNAEMIEKYTDENIYWLSVSPEETQMMNEIHQVSVSTSPVGNFPSLREFEHDLKWWTLHFTSEETWFLESNIAVGATTVERTLHFSLPSIDFETELLAELQLELTSNTLSPIYNPDHQIEILLNDHMLQTASWDGRTWQSIRVPFAQSLFLAGDNSLKLRYLTIANNYSNRYGFDQFNIYYHRLFEAVDNELAFSAVAAGDNSFTINGFTDQNLELWDISQPLNPQALLDFVLENGTFTFSNLQTQSSDFIVFGDSAIHNPEMKLVEFEDFSSAENNFDYLIISSSAFIPSLQPLIDWRTQQGLQVKIIDLQTIYDQYNFGIAHPIAVKNFMKMVFQSWQTPPMYILVVGDGHWDLKNEITEIENYFPPNFVWVDPVQGEIDSLSDLVAVVGDDPIPDAMIGRYAVNTLQELSAAIAKTIAFEQSQGDWLKSLSFVVDNYYLTDGCFDEDSGTLCTTESGGNFPALMESFLTDMVRPPYTTNKFYLDDYHCTSTNATACDELTNDLIQNINQTPSQIYTYSGHGAINGWANERIFNVSDMGFLNNQEKFPVFFSLDCIDGFWYFPPDIGTADNRSLAEELVRAPLSGASAMYAATGFGYASGHDILQRGFFQEVFGKNNPTIGEADLSAKLNVYANGNNDEMLFTYMIFGDPAMRLFNDRFFTFLPLLNK